MNPYILLAVVLAWGASVTGAFFFGRDTGQDNVIAEQEKTRVLVEDIERRAQQGAAAEIAKIKVVNQINREVLEREIVEKPVYRECRNTADGVRAINAALENRPVAPDGGELPGADPAH